MSDRRTFIKNGGALLASVPLAAMSAEESQVSARKGKVLLLNGSPHLAGCVYTDLTVIAKTLAEENIESEIYQLGPRPVRGCIGCFKCGEKGKCVFSDTLLEVFLSKLDAADGLIVGSPVYYAGPNGSLCAFLDRACLSGGRYFSGKFAAAVVNARRGGCSAAFDRLNKYFTILNMSVVSSSYWNQTHGLTPEQVLKDLEGMQVLRTLARNMAQLIRDRKAAGDKLTLPTESKISTNFIR